MLNGGLVVETGDTWPGVRSSPADYDEEIVIKRPKGYFPDDGSLPERVTLKLQKLPAMARLADDAYVQKVKDAVNAKEAELRSALLAERRTFLGARAVMRQSPFNRPRTHEPRRQMSPRIASPNKWARIEALFRLEVFVDDYRDAWQRYRAGRRDAVFPAGTYWLRVYASVTCVPG